MLCCFVVLINRKNKRDRDKSQIRLTACEAMVSAAARVGAKDRWTITDSRWASNRRDSNGTSKAASWIWYMASSLLRWFCSIATQHTASIASLLLHYHTQTQTHTPDLYFLLQCRFVKQPKMCLCCGCRRALVLALAVDCFALVCFALVVAVRSLRRLCFFLLFLLLSCVNLAWRLLFLSNFFSFLPVCLCVRWCVSSMYVGS